MRSKGRRDEKVRKEREDRRRREGGGKGSRVGRTWKQKSREKY